MLKFGIKSAILGSVVYYTIDKGVWKDSATTATLYEDLENGVSPYVGNLRKQVPVALPQLPSNNKTSYLLKYYWNTGVKSTFSFLVDLPSHAGSAVCKSYNYVASSLTKEKGQEIQISPKN